MDNPAVEVQDYLKQYRDVTAVHGLSFEVRPGEILGLLGPNGAGKTTVLRALSGIIPPTRGVLRIAGHDVVQEPVEAKRRLAYVPDDPKLFDALTVWEHLQFTAAAYGLKTFAAEGDALLEEFELTPKRDALAQELSRGMRQKTAICCACLHEPAVFLFDEPMTGLDPRGIRTLKESIQRRAEAGKAVIVSSHLLALIQDLCTGLLIIHRGRRVFAGPLEEARAAFADMDADASLEEVFFRATRDEAPAPEDGSEAERAVD